MARPLRPFAQPPKWAPERLDADRKRATELFRAERIQEPQERYERALAEYRGAFDELLRRTTDLATLHEPRPDLFESEVLFEALRYLPGPPISLDDLKVLVEAPSLSEKALRDSPPLRARLAQILVVSLDRSRFPWLGEERPPAAGERESAILASAAMLAMRKVETARRSEGKTAQEGGVSAALVGHGFRRVETRAVIALSDGPGPGEFCGESPLGARKADLLVGLWDRRIMAIECKVSNSATNSIKRLNNDAVAKSQAWRQDFGESQVVPTALLSGVYNLKNLLDAQERHLTIFWEHSLTELLAFIDQTKEPRA